MDENLSADMVAAEPEVSLSDLNETEDGTQWQEPILFGEINTPEIPASLLPGWLGEFAEAISEANQTPPAMAVIMCLAAVATCVQRRWVITPYGDYKEPLSFWGVVALPPASRKSAIVSLVRQPIQAWEKEKAESLKQEIASNESRRAVALKRIEGLTKQASSAKDDDERKALIEKIDHEKATLPEEIKTPRLWTNDATPEKMQSLLVENGERMSVLSDEGGIFEVMSGLYSDGRANIDVFLQGHAGTSLRVDRGSRTVHLSSPALSFGITVQPSVIAELGQGSKKRFRGNGALARFMYAVPRSNIGSRDVAERPPVSGGIKAGYEIGITRLLQKSPATDPNGKEIARVLTLEKKAKEIYLEFAAFVEMRQGEGGEYESIQDWTGKLPGAALRIAGLCHLAEAYGEGLLISADNMERAVKLCRLLIPHTQAAFDLLGGDQCFSDAKHILRWIEDGSRTEFRQNELHKTGRFSKSKIGRLSDALDLLQERHIISARISLNTRKPTFIYRVNPLVLAVSPE